jgi:hypothetical protein
MASRRRAGGGVGTSGPFASRSDTELQQFSSDVFCTPARCTGVHRGPACRRASRRRPRPRRRGAPQTPPTHPQRRAARTAMRRRSPRPIAMRRTRVPAHPRPARRAKTSPAARHRSFGASSGRKSIDCASQCGSGPGLSELDVSSPGFTTITSGLLDAADSTRSQDGHQATAHPAGLTPRAHGASL